jgi:hypothetical protein
MKAVRVTRTARKHKVSVQHILAAMIDAGEPEIAADGALHYVGTDDRGIELHIVAVADDKRDGIAVIHAMPTEFRRKK